MNLHRRRRMTNTSSLVARDKSEPISFRNIWVRELTFDPSYTLK